MIYITLNKTINSPSDQFPIVVNEYPQLNTDEWNITNVTSTNGYLDITDIKDVDELNSAQLFTPTELLTPPGVRHDDPQRTAMMRGQTTHMVLVEDMSPVLIGNKVESVIPYHLHNEFCFVAKNDGKVIDEQNGVYVIQQ